MTWDQTICACVGIQPNLCPNSAEPLCIQQTYSPLTCDCISSATYSLMQSLNPDGEDCIPGNDDDPQNPEPCQDFPFGWTYDETYCQCVAPVCENFDQNILCDTGLVLDPIKKCECIPEAELEVIIEESCDSGDGDCCDGCGCGCGWGCGGCGWGCGGCC